MVFPARSTSYSWSGSPAVLGAVALGAPAPRGPALRQLLLLRKWDLYLILIPGASFRRLPDRWVGRGQSAPPDAAVSHRPLSTFRLVSNNRRTRLVPAPAHHLQLVLNLAFLGASSTCRSSCRHGRAPPPTTAGVALDLPPGHLVLLLPSRDLHHRPVSQGRQPVRSLLAHMTASLFSHYARPGDYARAGACAAVEKPGKTLTIEESGRALFRIALGLLKKFNDRRLSGGKSRQSGLRHARASTPAWRRSSGVWAVRFLALLRLSGLHRHRHRQRHAPGHPAGRKISTAPIPRSTISAFLAAAWHITLSNWLRDYLYFSLPRPCARSERSSPTSI